MNYAVSFSLTEGFEALAYVKAFLIIAVLSVRTFTVVFVLKNASALSYAPRLVTRLFKDTRFAKEVLIWSSVPLLMVSEYLALSESTKAKTFESPK